MIDPLQASMSIASSGLSANSTRLKITSENIANAQSTGQTPGADPYRRKTITFESALDEVSGAEVVKVGSSVQIKPRSMSSSTPEILPRMVKGL